MADIAMTSDRGMSIGRVFSRAFGTIGARPLTMFGISLLFGALPGVLINLAGQSTRLSAAAAFSEGVMAVSFGVFTLTLAFSFVAQGALVRATVAHSDGHDVRFADSAVAGLRKIVPLFILAILLGLGVMLGLLLLIVPGIILYLVWAVAAPALVEEDCGILGAFSRSADLTRGARWNIFAIQLVSLLFYYVIAAIAGIVLVMVAGGVEAMVAARQGNTPLLNILVTGAFNTLSITITAAIQTSLYVELRNWKDGPPSDALGDIFA